MILVMLLAAFASISFASFTTSPHITIAAIYEESDHPLVLVKNHTVVHAEDFRALLKEIPGTSIRSCMLFALFLLACASHILASSTVSPHKAIAVKQGDDEYLMVLIKNHTVVQAKNHISLLKVIPDEMYYPLFVEYMSVFQINDQLSVLQLPSGTASTGDWEWVSSKDLSEPDLKTLKNSDLETKAPDTPSPLEMAVKKFLYQVYELAAPIGSFYLERTPLFKDQATPLAKLIDDWRIRFEETKLDEEEKAVFYKATGLNTSIGGELQQAGVPVGGPIVVLIPKGVVLDEQYLARRTLFDLDEPTGVTSFQYIDIGVLKVQDDRLMQETYSKDPLSHISTSSISNAIDIGSQEEKIHAVLYAVKLSRPVGEKPAPRSNVFRNVIIAIASVLGIVLIFFSAREIFFAPVDKPIHPNSSSV